MSVKQKLFLLLVAGFLITAPALAAAANPVRVDDTLGFGTSVATHSDTVNNEKFTLTVNAEVFEDAGLYTYVYTLTLVTVNPSAIPPLTLDQLTIFNGLYDDQNWGWVGDPDVPPPGPFSLLVGIVTGQTDLFFESFTDGTLVVYLEAGPNSWKDMEYFFATGSGGSTGAGTTLGPTDAGGGASFNSVPETSSLLLLTFGLLSGGVLRFSIRRTRV